MVHRPDTIKSDSLGRLRDLDQGRTKLARPSRPGKIIEMQSQFHEVIPPFPKCTCVEHVVTMCQAGFRKAPFLLWGAPTAMGLPPRAWPTGSGRCSGFAAVPCSRVRLIRE